MTIVSEKKKSDTALRTISEVSEIIKIPQHVLRFWESKFNELKPYKFKGSRRYYKPEDIQLLTRIKDLLYVQGYTIKGVQKFLKEKKHMQETPQSQAIEPSSNSDQANLEQISNNLRSLKNRLEQVLS